MSRVADIKIISLSVLLLVSTYVLIWYMCLTWNYCNISLPENSIQDFIVDEILSEYTFLFRQKEQHDGPGGEGIHCIFRPILLFLILFPK